MVDCRLWELFVVLEHYDSYGESIFNKVAAERVYIQEVCRSHAEIVAPIY